MSLPYTRLRGVSDFSKDNLGRLVEENLVEFLNWGLVNAGGFVEVPVPTPGTPDPYGDEVLYAVHKEGVADGTFWQSRHPNWCHEVGTDASPGPTVASGIRVNGTFHPQATTTGTYAHTLDFPHGRVVMANPLPPNSLVQVAYSYRAVSCFAQDQPWFRPVVLGDFGQEQSLAATATGIARLLDDYSVRTPMAVVQSTMRRSLVPYELGTPAGFQRRDVLFSIVADDGASLKNIADAISLQEQSTIILFDANARRAAGAFPLDFHGTPIPGGPQYPDLVAAFPIAHLHFAAMQGSDVSPTLPLFRGTIRATVEVLFGGV